MTFYNIPSELKSEIDSLEKMILDVKAGKLSAQELKPRRVPMGVYEQRKNDTYMMRIRTPGGAVTPQQLLRIAEASRRWGSSYFHVTTRQEFQIHYVALENVIPAMRFLLEAGLSTRGGGGNTVRNIVSSVDSGIDPLEVFDVSPFAAALTSQMISESDSWTMPRKFKFAFSNSPSDTAMASVADVGFVATEKNGEKGFKVYLAGGMGAKSAVGILAHEFITVDEVYAVARAAKNLFNNKGNRKNKHHNRLRFLREDLGKEKFLEEYHNELEAVHKLNPEPLHLELEKFENKSVSVDLLPLQHNSNNFVIWKKRHVAKQKQEGLHSVVIPFALGKIDNEKGIELANFLMPFGRNVLRATKEQNLKLRNIHEKYLGNIFEISRRISELSEQPAILGDTIACAGADTCRLGICLSRGAVTAITKSLSKSELDLDRLSGFRMNLSGCPNSCGQHQTANLGFYGRTLHKNDRYYPAYTVVAGAQFGDGHPRLAKIIGDIPSRSIADFTKELLKYVIEKKREDESFDEFMQNSGLEEANRLVKKYRELEVPLYEDDPAFYHDWSASEPFTLAGRGSGECSAGLFDLIEFDLKNINAEKKELSKISETEAVKKHLYNIAHFSARMLIITRGVDAGSEGQVFKEFQERFILPGLVEKRFERVVMAGLSKDLSLLFELKEEVLNLSEAVKKLYESMDDQLRFPNERNSNFVNSQTKDVPVHDFRGVGCPMNFVKVKLVLSKLPKGSKIEVLLDDGEPIRNVPRSVELEGHRVIGMKKKDSHWSVVIEKR